MPRKRRDFREEVEDEFEDFRQAFESKAKDQKLMLDAIQNNHLGQLRNLISRGVDSNFCDRYGASPLHIVTQMPPTSENLETLELLVYSGAPLERRDRFGISPLHNACSRSVEAVSLLLNAGSSLNGQDNAGRTPLMYACESESAEAFIIIQSLLDWGANVRLKDEDGQTALHYVVKNSKMEKTVCKEVVYRLLYAGALVNEEDNAGCTPLTYAMWKLFDLSRLSMGHQAQQAVTQEYDLEIVLALLKGGASVKYLNMDRILEYIIFQVLRLIEPYLSTEQMYKLYCKYKQCPEYNVDNNFRKCKEVLTLLQTSSRRVRSLKNCCRTAIRKQIGENLFPTVDKLDIPRTLIDYLKYMS